MAGKLMMRSIIDCLTRRNRDRDHAERERTIRILIATVALLTGCVSTPKDDSTVIRNPREAIVPSDPDAQAKLEADRAARAEEEQAQADALAAELHKKRVAWTQMPEAQPFLRWYCALTPGTDRYAEEIFIASGKQGIVPKRNPSADAMAERLGFAVVDCEKLASSGATE